MMAACRAIWSDLNLANKMRRRCKRKVASHPSYTTRSNIHNCWSCGDEIATVLDVHLERKAVPAIVPTDLPESPCQLSCRLPPYRFSSASYVSMSTIWTVLGAFQFVSRRSTHLTVLRSAQRPLRSFRSSNKAAPDQLLLREPLVAALEITGRRRTCRKLSASGLSLCSSTNALLIPVLQQT